MRPKIIALLKKILLLLYSLAHLFLATFEWLTIAWAVRLWKKSENRLAIAVLPILLIALSYDNFVIGSGIFIGAGPTLETLNKLRYLLHYLVIPFFLVVGVEIARGAGARWANKFVRVLSWIGAIALAGFDIYNNYLGLQLEPKYFAGILHYVPVNPSLPIVTIAMNVFMLLIGIGVWVRMSWSILFVGTLLAFIGNTPPLMALGPLSGSVSEFILAISFLLTEQRLQSKDQPLPIDDPDFAQNFQWNPPVSQAGYTVYQAGQHINGDFVQALVPDQPKRSPEGKLKVITYLHGFALCLPKFYQQHLADLARSGYYVIFPDFQKSRYSNDLDPKRLVQAESTSIKSAWESFSLRGGLRFVLKRLRASFSLTLIILFIRLVFLWFDKTYGKNLISLLSTVALSLLYSPEAWNKSAIKVTQVAWDKLGENHPEIKDTPFDFYVFGHSLGGLLALSWPKYLKQELTSNQQKLLSEAEKQFTPKQILVADPAPSTEMGIPSVAIFFLKIFNSPFAEDPIRISEAAADLKGIPVGILHGKDDKIVKLSQWIKAPPFAKRSNFDYVKDATAATLYASLSNKQDDLIAFHNQAVTNTTYYDDALFKNFGGVKEAANAYNYEYIWPGFNAVVENQGQADDLKAYFKPDKIKIVVEESSKPQAS
ncbi:MAG: hypothetical protein AAGG51_07145 [Cyanobacteria bacterium P01_G01_bin.54]